MKILVTGASGFVAEHLIPLLRAKGHYVVGTDREMKPAAICDAFIQIDLCNCHAVDLPDCDLVIHLAAARADWGISVAEHFRDNHQATERLLSVCHEKKISRFLFVSTIAVYGDIKRNNIDEQTIETPNSAYGKSKLSAEKAVIKLCNQDPNFGAIIMRPTVIFGPSNPEMTGIYRATDNNIFRLVDGILNRRFAIVGDGKTVKSVAYVKNFAHSLVFSLEFSVGYEIFNYTDEPAIDMNNLVQMIKACLGLNDFNFRIPMWLALPVASVFDILASWSKVNFPITKARINTFTKGTNCSSEKLRQRGFEQPIKLDIAVQETVDWYLKLIEKKRNNFFFIRKDAK